MSCGKGRDMGFDSILGYQKKIGGGAGDVSTSREVARMGARLDFFRLMSYYHGGAEEEGGGACMGHMAVEGGGAQTGLVQQ